jgi:hypothetical protein
VIYVGIDNGADGGFVALANGLPLLHAVAPVINIGATGKKKRIPDPRGMAELIRSVGASGQLSFVVLEQAQAYPKEGAVASFNYGRGFGAWEGVLAALGIPHAIIGPREWQRYVLAGIEGADADPKARALLYVQRAIPTLQIVQPRCRVPHTGVVDAACMAVYARMLHEGRRPEPKRKKRSAGEALVPVPIKVPPPPPLPVL